jgi:hypothetical protein
MNVPLVELPSQLQVCICAVSNMSAIMYDY